MKHKPTDMKEILTTGEDRVAKVNELKEFFSRHKDSMKFSVTRRKLASGIKFYFHVQAVGVQYLDNPDIMWKDPLRDFVMDAIKREFPEAYLTSGGTIYMTFASHR